MESTKYREYRKIAKDGDLSLFSSIKPIALAIRFADRSKYSHVGIVKWWGDRLMVIHATGEGVHASFFSDVLLTHYVDFDIVRPLRDDTTVSFALERIMDKADLYVRYDRIGGTRELLRRGCNNYLGTDFKAATATESQFVCSTLAKKYFSVLDNFPEYVNEPYLFPQDIKRYYNPVNMEFLKL